MIEQVEASGFELVPDEAKSEQPDTETVFVVGGDGPIRFCVLLIVSLGRDRKTELDVCLDLSRMDFTVEGSKLNGALLKHTVEIQAVITAAVVMLMASVRTMVPNRFQLLHGLGLLSVDLLQKTGFYPFAVVHFSALAYLQCLIDHVLFGGNNVDQVSQFGSSERCSIHMDMNTAGAVYKRSVLPEFSE